MKLPLKWFANKSQTLRVMQAKISFLIGENSLQSLQFDLTNDLLRVENSPDRAHSRHAPP